MDDIEWEQERQAQNSHLRDQIHALLKRPPAKRRKFQLLLVICQKCGNPLVEVLDTLPFPCLRLRRLVGRQGAGDFYLKRRQTGTPWSEFFKNAPVSLHLDDWSFMPIGVPSAALEAESRGQILTVACKCGTQDLTVAWIIRHVRERSGRIVLPRPRHARS